MKKILSRPELILIFAAIIVLAVIYITPIGVSDNGSSSQLLTRMGIEPSPSADGLLKTEYNELQGDKPSSSFELLIYGVKKISDPFSVKILFLIYSVLFLAGLYLIIKNISKNSVFVSIASIIVPLLIFCDFSYTCYFMSIYQEPFIFSVLILFIGLLLDAHKNGGITWIRGIFIALCGMAFAAVNFMTAVIAVVLGAAVILFWNMDKKPSSIICGTVIIVLSVVFMYTYVPADRSRNLYNSVFYGICNYDSVTEIGLNESLDELKGVPYSAEIAEKYDLKNRFYQDINYADIIGYYASHPASFAHALTNPPSEYGVIRDADTGSYTDKPNTQANGFCAYSMLKQKLLGKNLSGMATWLFIYYVIIIVAYKNSDKKRRVFLNLLIIPGISGALSLVFPLILSGTQNFGRNMFMFNVSLDFMVFISIVGGIWELLRRRRYVRDKYGVTQ